ncbi:MAG: DUF1330 domain-containing protein [Saprospiraceae bacterium]|nr:DUF1330 domain-containing protein [Saprospiraceae bacterium]
MRKKYIKVTEEAGKRFFSRPHTSPVVMLNLLKFRQVADYSSLPLLKPEKEISGKSAYRKYSNAVLPMLVKIGSEVIFSGSAKEFLIGPNEEEWDYVLLVKHQSVSEFLKFATNEQYLAIEGHRTAALDDSRLLPITES